MKETAVKFSTAYQEIKKQGFEPINPVELVQDYLFKHYRLIQLSDNEIWKIAMKECIKALVECDGILLLPCNLESRGATIERNLAQALEIPVFYDINLFKELWNY